jgi:hypothetical protein
LETVKKPSVVCEALFKPLWESAVWADFHQRRQFPQAFPSFFFAPFFFLDAHPQFFVETFRVRRLKERRFPSRSTYRIPCLVGLVRSAALRSPKGRASVEEAKPESKAPYNFTDSESRIMKGADGFVQAYNTQIAVEPNFQWIVGQRVTQAVNDKQQMVPR